MSTERKKRLTIELEIYDDSEAIILLRKLMNATPSLLKERTVKYGEANLTSNCVYIIDWTEPIESVDEKGNCILTFKSDFS